MLNLLETVAYTRGYYHRTLVILGALSHPLHLSVYYPMSAHGKAGSQTQVETARPPANAIRANLVYANTNDGKHVPIVGDYQWYLEVAIYIYRAMTFTDDIYAWLNIKPVCNAIITIDTCTEGFGSCIE